MMKLRLLAMLLVLSAVGCGGYGSNSGSKPSTTPNIAMLAPASATAGGETFMLTVTGTGFAGNSAIYWNSTTLTTTFVSAQELTAEISANDIADAGTATVYVKNPGTGVYATGVNSNAVSFMIE